VSQSSLSSQKTKNKKQKDTQESETIDSRREPRETNLQTKTKTYVGHYKWLLEIQSDKWRA